MADSNRLFLLLRNGLSTATSVAQCGPWGSSITLTVRCLLPGQLSCPSLPGYAPLPWASGELHSDQGRVRPCCSEPGREAKGMRLPHGKACCPSSATLSALSLPIPEAHQPNCPKVQHTQMEQGPLHSSVGWLVCQTRYYDIYCLLHFLTEIRKERT